MCFKPKSLFEHTLLLLIIILACQETSNPLVSDTTFNNQWLNEAIVHQTDTRSFRDIDNEGMADLKLSIEVTKKVASYKAVIYSAL